MDQQFQQYRFGEFVVDPRKRSLTRLDGKEVPLTPKVFDLLVYLLEHRGRLLEKDELMSSIWPDTVVEESNLSQNISVLRRALDDTRGTNRCIVTIPGRGYKFVAEVTEPDDPDADRKAPVDVPQTGPSSPVPLWARSGRGAIIGIAAVALFTGALLLAIFVGGGEKGSTASTPARTIAVLPFKPLVAEPGDEVLEIGMADTLISKLGGIHGLVVRPLASVRRIHGTDLDPLLFGRELGVEAVLEGSIQRWGDKLRVNVRLISVTDGRALWNGTFDEQGSDIFAIQDAIALKVGEALQLHISGVPNNAAARETQNVEAYRYYLQGRYHVFKLIPAEVRKGIEYYQRAIDLDPLYALAYAGLADAYRSLPINSDIPSKDALPLAKSAAKKALEIDPDLAEAHVALGWAASWYDRDSAESERHFKRAIELTPQSADAHRGYAGLLTILGRHDEAVAEIRRAREIDPLSLITNALEGQTLYYAGRNGEAIDRLNKTLEIDPQFWIAHINLAKVYIQQEKFDEALAALRIARESSSGNSETISLSAYALAKAGRRSEALDTISELENLAGTRYVPPYNIALAYQGLGEKEKTLEWLEKAVDEIDVRIRLINVDHKWDALREEPRFIEIIRKVNV